MADLGLEGGPVMNVQENMEPTYMSNPKSAFILFNRPGVAGAILQSLLSFINTLIN